MKQKNSSYVVGLMFALINMVTLGISGVIDKLGSSQVENPLLFSIQSILFALLFSLLFSLLYFRTQFTNKLQEISSKSWFFIFLIGTFASGVFIMFRFIGLTESTGTFATLSQIITTTLTAIIAYIFLKEHLSNLFWIFFVVILGAMYFVSIGKVEIATIQQGDLYILSGTIFLAAGNIFSRLVVQKANPYIVAIGRFLFGVVFLMFVTVVFFQIPIHSDAFTLLGIVSGLFWATNVITFNLALQRIGVTIVTSLLMLSPIITMILEYLFLNQIFTFVQVVAAGVVMTAGIILILIKK